MPNSGKSTLFNALTGSDVPAENFPFCTIDPNVGKAAVPDTRLQEIADTVSVTTIVPAVIDFVDIAGLVEGASRGEGLGNRFLAHIREMDLIAHVIGAFNKDSNWQSEVDVINLELMLADLETVQKSSDKGNQTRQNRRSRAGETGPKCWHTLPNGLQSGVALKDQNLETQDRQVHRAPSVAD